MPVAERPETSDFPRSPALLRVARGDLCAGCGACALIAPERIGMEMRPPGFLRPRQSAPLSTAEEEAIAAVCPGLGLKVAAGGRPDHPLWGPHVSMCTGHAADPELRFTASSGGALSALLLHLLETGEVDGVVEIAADPENPLGNRTVLSRRREEVLAAAGSRYAPSAPLADLGGLIESGGRYAFVGKPCDVAALRALAARNERLRAAFPWMLSFFCAGVPSQRGAEEVLAALGVAPGEVEAFRYRGRGWPGRATAITARGEERTMSYHESWGKILSRHVQHRCKICADGTAMAADVVCADAWEVDARGYPLFEEREGISLIVARTGRGEDLVRRAGAAGRLATAPFEVEDLARIQPGQTGRRRALFARLLGLRLTGRPVPRYEGLNIRACARRNSLRSNLKNFLGMVRRVLRGRVGHDRF